MDTKMLYFFLFSYMSRLWRFWWRYSWFFGDSIWRFSLANQIFIGYVNQWILKSSSGIQDTSTTTHLDKNCRKFTKPSKTSFHLLEKKNQVKVSFPIKNPISAGGGQFLFHMNDIWSETSILYWEFSLKSYSLF